MMSLVLRLYSQLLEHPSQLWEGITSFLRSFHRHLGILDGLVYWSSLLSKVLMKRMFPEEVRGLYIATFLAEVCLDFIWVIVQLRCILEVIKEEKFCTSFSLKEFNVTINTFLGIWDMLAVESPFSGWHSQTYPCLPFCCQGQSCSIYDCNPVQWHFSCSNIAIGYHLFIFTPWVLF